MTPDIYRLTPEDRKFEKDELRFQKQVNSTRFLTWAQVLRQMKPKGKYQIYDGYIKQVGHGEELLEEIHQRVLERSYTRVMTVTEVPQDFKQPISELWATYTDPKTQKTMVEGHRRDVWNTDSLTSNPDFAKQALDFPLDDEMAQTLTDIVIQQRALRRRCDEEDILEKARDQVMLAVKQSYSHSIAAGTTEEVAREWAFQPGGETFDRVYDRERILKQGISLEDHPEFRTYQTFFELGMAPPTHEEMADYIITTFSPPK